MKKISLILMFVMLTSTFSYTAFADQQENMTPKVHHEDYSKCKDYDISNIALDEYIQGITDPERKMLMEKYFYLPGEVSSTGSQISQSELEEEMLAQKQDPRPLELAKELNELPIEELREKVKRIESNFENLTKQQNKLYEENWIKFQTIMENLLSKLVEEYF